MQDLQRKYIRLELEIQNSTTCSNMDSPVEHSPSEISITRSILSPAFEHPLQDMLGPMSPTSFSGEDRSYGCRRSISPLLYSSAYLAVSIYSKKRNGY